MAVVILMYIYTAHYHEYGSLKRICRKASRVAIVCLFLSLISPILRRLVGQLLRRCGLLLYNNVGLEQPIANWAKLGGMA